MTRALDINSPSGKTEWIADMTIEGLYGRLKAGISRIKDVTNEVAGAMLFDPSNVAFDSFNGSGRPFEEQQTSLNHLLMVSEEMANGINKLVNKDDGLYMDGYELARRGTSYINQENSIRTARATRLSGLTT